MTLEYCGCYQASTCKRPKELSSSQREATLHFPDTRCSSVSLSEAFWLSTLIIVTTTQRAQSQHRLLMRKHQADLRKLTTIPTDSYHCRLALLPLEHVKLDANEPAEIRWYQTAKTQINGPDTIKRPTTGLIALNNALISAQEEKLTLVMSFHRSTLYSSTLKMEKFCRFLWNSWGLLHSLYSVGVTVYSIACQISFTLILLGLYSMSDIMLFQYTSAMDKDTVWDRTKAFNSIFEFLPDLLFVCIELNPRRISLAALQKNPFIFCFFNSISLFISIVWLFLSSLKSTNKNAQKTCTAYPKRKCGNHWESHCAGAGNSSQSQRTLHV